MPSPLVQTHRLPVGTILEDRYELTGFIGAGGFAQVYAGRQLAVNRPVAIKILQPRENTDQDAYEQRFLREAQTAAQIRHPSVVTIYDYGVTSQQPYIVMELLEGHDLNAEIKKNGALGPERALRLMLEVLDALGEGHGQGIIHKDLKPANLFLTDPGARRERLKVLDFGIARLDSGSHLTGTGQLMGTPKYYAPEYIKSQIVTPSLDVYQMGLILVEMLAGHPVVNIEDPYVCLMRHSTGELEIPQSLLSGPLGPVIQKALALEHTERYTDAYAFREALEGVNPAGVTPVAVGEPMERLSEVSGNHKAYAVYSGGTSSTGPDAAPNHTGQHAQPGSFDQDSSSSQSGRARISRKARGRSSTSQSQPTPRPQLKLRRPPKPRRSRGALILTAAMLSLGLLAVVMAVGFVVVAFSDNEPTPTPAPPQEVVVEEGAPADPPPDKPGAQGDEAPMPDFDMAAANPVAVEVQSDPPGAEVFRGAEALGTTPVTLNFDSEAAEPVLLTLKARRHLDREIEVRPGDHPTLDVSLERDPRSLAVRPDNRQPPPRGPSDDKVTAPADKGNKGNDDKGNADKGDKGNKGNNHQGGGFVMPPPE